MTEAEQANAFAIDLHRLVDRYCDEFDLSVFAAIGALETVKLELFSEQREMLDDPDNP